MADPNLVNVTSIYGKSVGIPSLSTTGATSGQPNLFCPLNKVLKVTSILIANKASVTVSATVNFYNPSATNDPIAIANAVSVPANSTLVLLSKDTSIWMQENDVIFAGASVADSLDLIISYDEMDDA